MKTAALFAAASAFVLSKVSGAPALDTRLPRYGAFGAWLARDCPVGNGPNFMTEFSYGNECGKCNNFYNNSTMQSVNVYYLDRHCIITLHQSTDCSDPGIVSGLGSCWDPEGGVSGWTLTCPWEDTSSSNPTPICRRS